ncbi:sensor histidine kinase [Micrococcus sp.]|uniref:sensor histidine kinase n=1 Tax=Micrococcus sp. TaxID=1271 RepID=UPI002A90CD3E|nr:histidine kinase [Micrococcus sp.]MDY6055798.1 histidine kinase [Micrococcus sp.]
MSAPPCPRRTLPREEWPLALGYSGVWLVFLLAGKGFALAELTAAGRPGTAWALAALTAAFCIVYLTAFVAPAPVRALSAVGNTVAYTAALVLIAVGMSALLPLAGPMTTPYLAAVWLFTHRGRWPLLVGAGIGLTGLAAIGLLTPAGQGTGALAGIGLALAIIMIVRTTTAREDSLRQAHGELALARQREQVARDVHDVLGHSLTAVHVKAQLLHRLIDADPARARREAEEIITLTRSAIAEVRSTVDGLSAPELGPELARARRALADAGLRLDAPSPDVVAEVPPAQAALFAWVLREAVTNVLRHAHAHTVRVRLAPGRLSVTDDGVGPSASRSASAGARTGQGLAGMRARVERAGGTVHLAEAEPGRPRPGTLLEVTVPEETR